MSKDIAKKGVAVITIPIVLSIIGLFIAQYNIVDSKVSAVRKEVENKNTAVVQRVSIIETEVPTLKEDLTEIKSDIKELLKRSK